MTTWDGLSENEKRAMSAYGIRDMDSAENRRALEIYRCGYIDGLEQTAREVERAVMTVVRGIVAGDVVPRTRPRPVRSTRAAPVTKKADLIAALRVEIAEAGQGAWLGSETALVKDYRVSRTTVREALGVLEAEGLIASQHGKGRYVL